MTNYNGNAKIINQADARIGSAINWENEVWIEPNPRMNEEKCVTDEYSSEGLCSTTYNDFAGDKCVKEHR